MSTINKTYRLLAGTVLLLILTGTISNAGIAARCEKAMFNGISISQAFNCGDDEAFDYTTFHFQANPEINNNISIILTAERSYALLPNLYRTNKGFLSYPKN